MIEHTEVLDLTPGTQVLLAMRANNIGWSRALIEVIDNSLDAGASSVQVTLNPRTIQVKDNGCGIMSMRAALRLGEHADHETTKSGRYGVGLKGAGLYAGGTTSINTVRGGEIVSTIMNWSEQAMSGSWSSTAKHMTATPQLLTTYDLCSPTGTTIVFSEIANKVASVRKILGDVGYQFTPGLRAGKTISVIYRGQLQPVEPMRDPPLAHKVESSGSINGKPFNVIAGVVPEGHKNLKHGFNIAKAHRMVKNTIDGTGDTPALQFYAYVELGDGWNLTTYKNDIMDDDYDALVSELQLICAEPLRFASNQSKNVELRGIESEVTDALNGLFGVVKEKREPPDNHGGTNTATGRNGKRENASQTQDGDGSVNGGTGPRPRKVRGASMVFGPLEDGPFGMMAEASATSKKHVQVVVNEEHPAIVRNRSNVAFLTAICAVAVSSYAVAHDDKDVRQALLRAVAEENQTSILGSMSDLLRTPQPKRPKPDTELAGVGM